MNPRAGPHFHLIRLSENLITWAKYVEKPIVFLVFNPISLPERLPIILKELIFPQNNISTKFHQL